MSETPQERAKTALAVDDALSQSGDFSSKTKRIKSLHEALRDIAAMPSQPCPHIRGTDEGSHWCALAEHGAPPPPAQWEPDWPSYPEWVEWAALTYYGDKWLFKNKPMPLESRWEDQGFASSYCAGNTGAVCAHWRTTLRRRPRVEAGPSAEDRWTEPPTVSGGAGGRSTAAGTALNYPPEPAPQADDVRLDPDIRAALSRNRWEMYDDGPSPEQDELRAVASDLAAAQKPPPADAARILHENIGDLYETTPPAQWEPDWSALPEWVVWAAVDEDGSAWAYGTKPQLSALSWMSNIEEGEPVYELDCVALGDTDWRTTLRRRPRVESNPLDAPFGVLLRDGERADDDDGTVEGALEQADEFANLQDHDLPHAQHALEMARRWIQVARGRCADRAYREPALQPDAEPSEQDRWTAGVLREVARCLDRAEQDDWYAPDLLGVRANDLDGGRS